MIKVIIADDHTIFRQGLLGLLQSLDEVIVTGEAENGAKALGLIGGLKPDIAILDISMPGPDFVEIAAKIKKEKLKTKIILLTMHNNPETARRAFQSGISGYILKKDAFDDLLYAIKSVASGGRFITPSLAAEVFRTDENRRKNNILTNRELEILNLIASGLTNKRIGEKLFISHKTVDTHRTKIMRKLDLHSTAEIVRYAINLELDTDNHFKKYD